MLRKVRRGLGHCTKVQLKGWDRSSKIANWGCQMPAKLLAKSAVFSWRLSDDNDDAARDVGR